MLRVRPVLHTPHKAEWAELLSALGLERIGGFGSAAGNALALGTDAGDCFAAGAGRVLVCEAESFGVELGFEVRDVQKFAAWTIGDGTPVHLREESPEHGSVVVAHLVAPDGVQFAARPVDPDVIAGTPGVARQETAAEESPETGASLAAALSVSVHWRTPDVPGVCATLENIGAKATDPTAEGAVAGYRAKHGGFIDVFEHPLPRIDLTFEYTGSVGMLEERLSIAGCEVLTLEIKGESTLYIQDPEGTRVRVNCTFRDGQ